MFCPLYTNKKVFNEFNELVEALGGAPLTEEEFRSSSLRMQRQGQDFSAMSAAYQLYDENNGNTPIYAKNGNPSKLFSDILDYTNGNRAEALTIKIGIMQSDDDTFSKFTLDENGEPIASELGFILESSEKPDVKINTQYQMRFKKSDLIQSFGQSVSQELLGNNPVDSSRIIQHMLSENMFSEINSQLAEVLQHHNIPVKIAVLGFDELYSHVNDETGQFILINADAVNKVSNQYLADSFLHEILHAITVNSINNPKTKVERDLKRITEELFELFDKKLPSKLYNRMDIERGYHILKNPKEFLAVFMTDETARAFILEQARKIDKSKNGRIFNFVKRFINKISEWLVNESLFNTTESKINDYRKQCENYIYGKSPIKIDWKNNDSKINSVLNGISFIYEETDDYYFALRKEIKWLHDNFEVNNAPSDVFHEVPLKLNQRLRALTSNEYSDNTKDTIPVLEAQLQMFTSGMSNKLVAIQQLVQQAGPQLIRDYEYILQLQQNEQITEENYMNYMHDNFGAYFDMFELIHKNILNSGDRNEFLTYLQQFDQTKDVTYDDIKKLYDDVSICRNLALDGKEMMEKVRIDLGKDILLQIGLAAKDQDILQYIEKMNPDEISGYFRYMGTADYSSDAAIRGIQHIVKDAHQRANRDAYKRAKTLSILRQNLKSGEHTNDLYEKDDSGKTTGLLVRSRNYGKFYRDYDNFIKQLNDHINKKYNLNRDVEDRSTPQEEEVRTEWNKLKNDWLTEHCERRYLPEYYEAQWNLSDIARNALNNINSEIYNILHSVTDEEGKYIDIYDKDGHPRYDLLSDEQYQKYEDAKIRKALLYSLNDANGNEKTGVELQITKELIQYRERLREISNKNGFNYDIKAWEKARLDVIRECGGENEYNKFLRGEDNNFDSKKLKKWDSRNSRLELKRDDDGNLLIMNLVESKINSARPDFGERYNEISKLINDKLKPYYRDDGSIRGNSIPNALKNVIKQLQKEQHSIKEQLFKNNPGLKQLYKDYSKTLLDFVKFEDTEDFKQAKSKLFSSYEGLSYDEVMTFLIGQYGTAYYDYRLNMFVDFRPYRWYSVMRPKVDTNMEHSKSGIWESQYTKITPNVAWLDKTENNTFLNPNYDEKENVTYIPKKSGTYTDLNGKTTKFNYDNQKAFDKIQKSETLKALYDEVLNVMHDANEKQKNRKFKDDYLIPPITGTVWKRISRNSLKHAWFAFIKWLGENLGFAQNPDDETEFGTVDNEAANKDQLGDNIYDFSEESKGRRADGRELGMIPQYYTKRLKDPSQLSADLINMVATYYKMSCDYENGTAIKDKVETVLDTMKYDVKYGKKKISGDVSNNYQMLRQWVDMNLYGRRINGWKAIDFNLFGKHFHWQFVKFLQVLQRGTTAINLGTNPKVAIVGFLTSSLAHTINVLTGQKYGFKESFDATKIVLGEMFKTASRGFDVAHPVTKNKVMGVMERWDIIDQLSKMTLHTNRNRLLRAVADNAIFFMMTNLDFIIKSIIVVSTMLSYRLVDGQFTSKDRIRMSSYDQSLNGKQLKQKRNEQIAKWKKGVSAWDAMEMKDGMLSIKPEYSDAFNLAEGSLSARAEKFAESADGMATKEQKIAITQNILGALLMIHRQYMPLMIQERAGQTVYDYDTEMNVNGQWRSLLRFIHIFLTNPATGIITGGALAAFISPATWLVTLGAITGGAYGTYQTVRNYKNKQPQSIKQMKNFFFGHSTEKEYQQSQINRWHFKQIFSELAIYNLVIYPLTEVIVKWADEDDEDRWWLQFLAYIALAFQWEAFTPYRYIDLINTFKSPSPATGTLDKVENFADTLGKTIFPRATLFNPSSFLHPFESEGEEDTEFEDDIVTSGTYSENRLEAMPWVMLYSDRDEFTKLERDLYKLTPWHNWFEQKYNSKAKLNYMKHQIMHRREDE